MTDLQSLHCALSEAESGSRELDAGIAWHVDGHSGATIDALRDGSPNADALVPRYTTSIDAITSLIERVLPGWGVQSGMYPAAAIAEGRLHLESSQGVLVHRHQVCAPTEPLARCLALVSALIAQEGEK